ncbi:MAG: hypothetical protein Q8876_07845 [Bacillota bacterium]|nr:hypothetical protein [Bacillota bacterium]
MLAGVFSSCKKQADTQNIHYEFNSDADITIGGAKYSCNLTHVGQGITNIEMNKPGNLVGISYQFEGNTCEIACDGVKTTANDMLLPGNSAPSVIAAVLAKISSGDVTKKEDTADVSAYAGHCDGGDFTVLVNDLNNFITKIELPKENMTVEFYDQQPML